MLLRSRVIVRLYLVISVLELGHVIFIQFANSMDNRFSLARTIVLSLYHQLSHPICHRTPP